jgi:hypothetical protein
LSETRTRTRTSRRADDEIAALLRLAEIDAALLAREDEGRVAVFDEVADERHGLGARLSPEVLEAYDRALRAGRQPAVVRFVESVCSGCHVRLHATLEDPPAPGRRSVPPLPSAGVRPSLARLMRLPAHGAGDSRGAH